MHNRHLAHWPTALPQHLTVPATNLYYNVEVAATRFPDKPFLLFYDTPITFRAFHQQTLNIAGYLQQVCGVKKGDRVLLYLQNSPQFMLAYYGILRADAVVVPVNPMNLGAELQYMVEDTGARVAFVAQDLLPAIEPLLGHGLTRLIAVTYADYLTTPTTQAIPPALAAARMDCNDVAITPWCDMLDAALMPAQLVSGPDDLCVMPYTSGTTGHPKGCMHTHRSVMYNAVSGAHWFAMQPDTVVLSVLPLFHVTGMQGTMNGPLYAGCTVVLLPRWDADAAAQLVERHRVNVLHLIATMVIDFLANPRIDDYDLRSVQTIRGGGAAMPEAVAQQLQARLGLAYIEGYGMSETIAPTHLNPPQRAKPQCLGVPIFDVDARVIDPELLNEVADAAFDMALALAASHRTLAGEVCTGLALRYIGLVAAHPGETLATLVNGALHVQGIAGARPAEWITRLAALAPLVATLDQLRAVGQVLAWRVGAAHFRAGALIAADSLPPALALAAMDASGSWTTLRQRMAADPYWGADDGQRTREVGAFTGFGGAFAVPPTVRPCAGGFMVASSDRYFVLVADAYGAVLHSSSLDEFDAAATCAFPPAFTLRGTTLVTGATTRVLDLPESGLTACCNDVAVAVTSPYTHAIRVVALR